MDGAVVPRVASRVRYPLEGHEFSAERERERERERGREGERERGGGGKRERVSNNVK